MATKKEAVAVGSPTPQGARAATATGDVRLPEMPPAESFVGLVAYVVDTATDESQYLPLEFLASGVQACVDATADAVAKTVVTVAATENAETAATGADNAAEVARGEAENLSALKEAVANATADAIEKTVAAETATGAANTAATNANNATADAIAKTEAAQTATEEAIAAKDAAIEATENLTGDVAALVLTDANKPRIQELAGIDYSLLTEQIVPGEFFLHYNGTRGRVYTRTFRFSTLCYLLSSENRGAWDVSYSIPGITGILSVTGTVIRGTGETMAIIPFKDFLFYAEIDIDNRVSFGGRGLLTEVGKNMVFNVVLKYTK